MEKQSESDKGTSTRLSVKKWFLLSTGILIAITIPFFVNNSVNRSTSNLNGEMASSMTDENGWKTAKAVYDFSVNDLDGNAVSMEKYKGYVVIFVNVATHCGLTRANYAQLNDIYNQFKDKGVRVAGFPCNQFGNQEPGCSVDIKEFLTKNKVEWDVYEKIDVNGKTAHPLWKWLQHEKGGFVTDGIKWNFTKFLVDRQGKPVKRYAPTVEPKTFITDIEAELTK